MDALVENLEEGNGVLNVFELGVICSQNWALSPQQSRQRGQVWFHARACAPPETRHTASMVPAGVSKECQEEGDMEDVHLPRKYLYYSKLKLEKCFLRRL